MFPFAAREFRHNPCLMTPLTFVGLLILCVFWTVAIIWKFPLLVLGYVLSPLLNRTQFLIEFLYPLGVGRWGHLMLCRLMAKNRIGNKRDDKNRGHHSRSLETRIEVIPKRLYIHPLPQLIDNLGYLVVCCPEQPREVTVIHNQSNGSDDSEHVSTIAKQQQQESSSPPPLVAFVVDCGDAHAVLQLINEISEFHYHKQPIHVQSILSTHKHHDHTAGNVTFLRHKTSVKHNFERVVGGAVERVPGCNFTVANGDLVPLPKSGSNDMADMIEVEAIATPAHTRGSITYALRLLPDYAHAARSALCILFTGDTMFSAGGGVPFEADVDPGQDQAEAKKTFTSLIKASASLHSVERCFAEILARALGNSTPYRGDWQERTLIMPGHEYSQELLTRQFAVTNMENCRWKNFTPQVFFEAASQLYVALHRRALPMSSGRLISAMGSTIRQEMSINPNFRSMRKRGEILMQAIVFWHARFAREKVSVDHGASGERGMKRDKSSGDAGKSESTETQWNLDVTDLARPVFTTVYAADLDLIIRDLGQGTISAREGAKRLESMQQRLAEPVIVRRPVPGALVSDRTVYRGLLALALLGSSPTALTLRDAQQMKLPPPVVKTSDRIQVSKSHLISVLIWLGLIDPQQGQGRKAIAMIQQLWKESTEDSPNKSLQRPEQSNQYDTIDPEGLQSASSDDLLDLGDLKWSLYGVPRQQSCTSFCLPCAKPRRMDPQHRVFKSGMKPHAGEIVRHDLYNCPLCRTRAGCAYLPADNDDDHSTHLADSSSNHSHGMAPTVATKKTQQQPKTPPRPVVASIGTFQNEEGEEDDGIYVEVTSMLNTNEG